MVEGKTVLHPFPTVVTVSSVMSPEGSFGLIERLDWQGIFVDADLHGSRLTGDPAVRSRWLELVGLDASARERLLFESLGATSMSADKALMLAALGGVTIHHIDAGNLAAILPTLPFGDEVRSEIEGWVLAGGEADVPAEELTHIEWTGVGYRLFDPESGESRYQLTGRLSGGMVAVPPFEVVEDTRDPLQYPSSDETNDNPDDAVSAEIFDDNLQIGVVGSVLSDGEAIALKARAFDDDGNAVSGAMVEFEVIAGGGRFGGSRTVMAMTNGAGIASADLTLPTRTDDNPYYLLFPEEERATRCALTVVTARVNGFGLRRDAFWEIAMPDAVSLLETPLGTSFEALPHVSVGAPLVAVPADQYGNPVSNVTVEYRLVGGAGEVGKGPELLGRVAKEQCLAGTVVAGECPGASFASETGGVTGT